ncbi:MAG: hypothetical protein JKX91_06565 [Rhizobiaceae bacterium]|nr:hypothetical protein [Rhizobiaceae bacterium]
MFFTTRAFATGIPTVLAGSPVVSAYEDSSVTQITAGITLGVSHDSVVGLNLLTVVATGGNGYETGKDYSFVITTGTVGGVSVVGEVVGEFSLSLSAAAIDLANGTDGLGAIKADTAAILIDTADIQPNYATSTALATVDTVVDGIQTDLSNGTDGLGAIKADTAAILVDTADIQPNYATSTALATVDTVVDGIQTDLSNGTDGLGAIKADTAAVLVDTADMQPKLGSPAADISADIAAVKVDTAAILVDTSTTLDTKINTIDTNVDAVLVDTGTTIPGLLGTPAADVSADIAAVKVDTAAILVDTSTTLDTKINTIDTNVDAVLVDTNELQGDWVNGGRLDLILDIIAADTTTDIPALIAALNDISTANVNTEVADVLFTDTHAELAAIPAANAPLADKINYIYMNIRNKMTQTATTATLLADDTTTSVGTSTVSDDGTTASKGEWS